MGSKLLSSCAVCLALWTPLHAGGRQGDAPRGVGPTLGADPDRDGDGLSDFQEVHKYRTDPARADSDGDGVPDGDWEERREYTYTVRSRVRVVRPVDALAACDDYQDARVLDEAAGWVELEVVHYPLGTAGEAIQGDPGWRERVDEARAYLESTTTSSWDEPMRAALAAELSAAGVDVAAADDLTLASAAAKRLMERSRFEDGFTTFYADFRRGKPVVPPALADVVAEHVQKFGRSVEEQWERELFATGMFENEVHGSCTSSAIYLCGGLRAAGIPTRIVLVIPIVDVNDVAQLRMVEEGIRHHGVRATALKGLGRLSGGWISHTFNEVWVDGRWRRLNYTRMGQPILDEGLYGLTTHVLTVRDWADARFARTVGKRQGLGERDEVFRTSNPYATLELDDRFGEHADIPNPEVEEPSGLGLGPLGTVRIERAAWVASDERPQHLTVALVDMERDRHHLILIADAEEASSRSTVLNEFWGAASKSLELRPAAGPAVPLLAVRGWWHGRRDGEPYLYFIARLGEDERAQLVPGATYTLAATADRGVRFTVEEGVEVVVPAE